MTINVLVNIYEFCCLYTFLLQFGSSHFCFTEKHILENLGSIAK